MVNFYSGKQNDENLQASFLTPDTTEEWFVELSEGL